MMLRCLRCGTSYASENQGKGCLVCLNAGYPVNLEVIGPWHEDAIGLRAGMTPMTEWPALASSMGCRAVFIKHENQNPTGSHKDRFSQYFMMRARQLKVPEVVAASSGNAGLSLAAFGASYHIPTAIIMQRNPTSAWPTIIRQYGAQVVEVDETFERWRVVEEHVVQHGALAATNYVRPPVGSNPFGLLGYTQIAQEIVDQLDGQIPDKVIIPCSRGDLLWGVYAGFQRWIEHNNLRHALPQLIAIEPFPRLSLIHNELDIGSTYQGHTRMHSIAGSTVTFQAWLALQRTHGRSIPIDDGAALQAQTYLRQNGLDVELSIQLVHNFLRDLGIS